MGTGIRETDLIPAVTLAVVTGTVARLMMLRIDYRQYPSYPQGYVIHLSLGFVASLLGAIVIPAILTGDFASASFLALAATQFREVRSVERETLTRVEPMELVPRGSAYIEGIARVFEARNYLAMVTALATTLGVVLSHGMGQMVSLGAGVGMGALAALLMHRSMQGKTIGDVAEVRLASITFEGPLLTVEGVSIMNVGMEWARRRYLEEGLAVVIEPRDEVAREILANPGQRQAIAHEASARLGVMRDVDEPEFMPLPRRDSRTGVVVMALVPSFRNPRALLEAIRAVPVLEGSVRRPLSPASMRRGDSSTGSSGGNA